MSTSTIWAGALTCAQVPASSHLPSSALLLYHHCKCDQVKDIVLLQGFFFYLIGPLNVFHRPHFENYWSTKPRGLYEGNIMQLHYSFQRIWKHTDLNFTPNSICNLLGYLQNVSYMFRTQLFHLPNEITNITEKRAGELLTAPRLSLSTAFFFFSSNLSERH